MNRSCIIFACTIISEERIHVLHEFLNSFKDNFADCDIFVGINSISLHSIESIIAEYDLNIVSVSRCQNELYTNSDASAYQVALQDLNNSGNTYENYWFIHTKSGVNNHSDYLRSWYISNFFNRRNGIETFINQNPGIGSYGLLGLEFNDEIDYGSPDCEIDLFNNTLTKDLPCLRTNFFYIHTIYVINKNAMQNFFKLITKKWFETKLDRYYFEGVFPFIVSRSGYFPYIENRYTCTGSDLYETITDWITINHLENYKKYSNIFKTNYLFHQLTPPYVISDSQS